MSLRVERLIFPSQLYDYVASERHMAFLPEKSARYLHSSCEPVRRESCKSVVHSLHRGR
jgi:hypothetical protein